MCGMPSVSFFVYSYNAEDYRVGKTILDDSGAKNVLYFYEGSRVIMEADEAGNITAHNLYGTNLISRSVQGEGYYYLYNAHGDVVMLMDTATGAIVATYRYDAFGNVIAQTGNPDNSITYAGYQYDEESGLYYLNARYYDSSTARFLTEDTYRGNYSDPLSLNRYTYCHNNPIIYTDPSGHSVLLTCLIFFVSGAILGGAMEIANQKLVQQRDEIDWTAVLYEAVMSGGFMALGAGQAQMALKSAQMLGQVSARLFYQEMAKTGAIEFIGGFMTDTGRQIIVEQRSFEEMDFGRSFSTGIWSGLLGIFGFGMGNTVGRKVQEVKDVFKQATKHADDVVPSISTYANILSDGQTGAKVPRGYPIVDDFIPVVRGSEVADDVLKTADGAGDGIVVPGNQGGSTNQTLLYGESGSNTDIPWSSGTVSDAAKQLQSGAKSVTVTNRSQAEELFLGLYQGEGYVNVTGMDAMDAKNLLGGKGNTYHWDDIFGLDGYLVGHGVGNPDAQMPHLQIHPQKGSVIRIFFDNLGGN